MKHFIQAYKSKVLFSLLLILIGLGGAGHEELQGQKTIYVNASALPGGNGLTWATAYTNLSQAIDTSIYDPGDQVWVARGTYYPDSAYASIGLGLRNKTYVLRSGLKIFGGFDSGDVALADRDYITNTTILSGDIGTLGDDTDNSFSVVTGWYTDSTAVLDGFTIQDGRATDSRLLGFVNGGGVYCPDHPFTTGADIRNCIIKNNIATSNGGGAYIWHNNVSFTDCIFENNSANEGGGVFAGNDAEGAFDGCIFINNKSTSFGGALAIRGAHSVVLNSRVSFNSANQNGGGLFVDGIARPYIAGSILEGNTASNNGGGVYSANQAEPTILSTLISGNFAQNQGAGIYTQDVGTLVNVINATIAGNRAGSLGGGVYQFSAQVEVRNSIVYGNEHGANNDPFSQQLNGSNINTEYSLVAGISTPANSTNINTDPLFINPLSAAIAPIIGGDYAVSKYSPVINAGDSTDFPADSLDLDKDGDIVELYPWDVVQSFRIDNDTLDMGAYETLDFCRPLGSSKLLVSNSSLGFCEGDSVNILARRGYSSYKWELDSTVFFPLNLMVNLDSVAKVKILITDTTGCSALDSITTTVYALPNPAIIPSSPAVCQGDSVWLKTNTLHPLTAWSTMEVADSINIKTGGQYIVNIVDANGCPGDDTLNILQVPKPTLTLSPPDSVAICDGDSVIIKASGAFLGYLWNTNETTDSIIVKTSGIYHVIATGVNSCVVTDSIIVTVLPSPTVVISPDGPLTFCDGDSVKLDAGLADSYRWSNSEITQEITVKQSGIYGVTVKNQFGCPAEDSVEVVVNALPDATIFYATDTIFCAGDSILLSVANNYDKYRWSNGDTTFTTIVKNTALYTVTISDTNNCQSIGQINTVASPLPQPVIQAAGGSTSFCQGGQALLGLGSGNYPSVLWEDGETLPRTFALTGGYFNVEVTDALGCKGEDSILITVFPNPVPTITPGGNVAICDGDTLSLDAGLYASYFWFHGNTRLVGESSQVLKTDSAGTYSVRVVDSNNCSGIDLVVVSVNPKPVLNAIIPNGPTTFCDGDSVELDAQPFAAYAWSSGESVQKITVKRSGNYRAIVANIFRCTDTAFIDVTVNPVPVAKITPLGSTTICFGDSLRLDGGVHDKYKWSTNDTTRFITVKVGGTFGLEVTNTFGCSAIDSITTLLGPVLNPNITLSGSSTLCQGDTLILDAGVFPSYNWSTGESSQTIKVARGDTFWVQVGVPIGCTGSDTVIVDLVNNPIPSILALGPTTFCDGDSVVLDADAYDGYLWSTGDTTRFITVDSAGIFEVLVTDDNLCQGLTSVSTQVNPTPVASISPSGATTFCEGDSVVLDGGLHFSYLWSNGENGRFTTIKASDTVGLKVTNALGCSDTDSIIIEVFSNPQATIIASNTTIFCQGDSVVLDVGNFASIAWSQDGIQIDTVRAIIARDDAEYTVLVTDTNGCSGEDTIFIVVNPLPQPVINVLSHASPDFCEGEQIFLEVGTFNGIMWSTGDITPVISVDTSQEVTVEVTDANNCKASDTLDVTAHPVPQPDIMAAPGVNICKGDTAILDAGGYNFYRWNNSLTDTLQILKVDTSGRYFVRVLNDFCLGYDSIDIVVSDNPILTLSPDTLTETCENTPITISSSTHSKYDWSTGDTTQSITVSTSDVYRLTVTEPSGCFTTDSVEVIAFSVPVPVIKASGLTTFCEGDSVTLSVPPGQAAYSWSDGSIDTSIVAKLNGWYWVDVTDSEGCIGRDSIFITVNPLPVFAISPPGPTSICLGTNVTLDAGAQPSGYTYRWSTGAISRTLSVNSTSQYYVDVTSPAGCSAADTTFVIASQTIFPKIVTSQPLPICEGQSVVLDAGAYQTFLWTPGLSTARTITVSQAGTYSVQVTDANGCRGDDLVMVSIAPNPNPQITALSDTIFCEGDSVILDGGIFPFHFWNTSQIDRQITVKTSRDYTVTVVDNNNCSAADTISVIVKPSPGFTLSSTPNTAICDGDSILLTASGGQPQYQYDWSTTETGNQIWTKTTDTYSLVVTDTNTCTSTDSIDVLVNPLPNVSIIPSGPLSFCDGDSVILDAGVFDHYLWNTGDTSQTITAKTASNYVVTVTNSDGCEKADSVKVVVFALPNVVIGPSDTLTGCQGDTLVADGGVLSVYNWSNNQTTRTIDITQGGLYTLNSTNGNGCSASDSVFVIINPLPVVNITAPATSICPGGSMVLDATPGFASYRWNNGDTLPSITITQGDTFIVEVTGLKGCVSSDTIIITTGPLIPVDIVALGDTVFCLGDSVMLETDRPFNTYQWSNTNTTPQTTIFSTGWVNVDVTDTDGCLGRDSIFVLVNPKPTVSISPLGQTSFCDGDSVGLIASSGFAQYNWSTGDTVSFTFAKNSGPTSILVTDGNGCQASDTITISVYPLPSPNININGPTSLCFGDQVTLSADTGFVSYSWLANGNLISNSLSITVDSGAVYTLQVTDGNGCVGENDVNVTVGSQLNPVINGDSILCQGEQATLFVGSFNNYTWKQVGRNDTISSSNSVIVSQTGSYWIEVRDNLGCSGRDTFDVFVAPAISLFITSNTSTNICVGDSVRLSANQAYASYQWDRGDTTRSIWVKPTLTQAFVLTVTDQYGCEADTFRSVIVNPLPNLNVISNIQPPYCEGDSVTLFAGTFPMVSWTRRSDGALLSRDTILTVSQNDWYRVQVTTAQGCSKSDSILVNFNNNPQPNIISSRGDSLLCQGDTVNLSLANAYASYLWNNVVTDSALSVDTAGLYIVEVTDGNGCFGYDSLRINEVITQVPVLPDSIITCEDRSIILDPGSFVSYRWNTGDSSSTILVDTSGTYVVETIDGNGCAASDSTKVIELPIPQVMITTSTGSTLACSADSIMLDAGGPYDSYRWLGLPDTTRFFTPITTGRYIVSVIDSNGCEGLNSIDIVILPSPVASFTGLDTTYCENSARDTLFGSPVGGTFSGPGIVNSGGLSFFVPALASTNNINIIEYVFINSITGCSDTARQAVAVIPVNATPIISGVADSICDNDLPAALQAINQNNGQPIAGGSFSGPGVTGPNSQGQWTFDPTLLQAGQSYTINYSFNAGFGCAANASKDVFIKQLPVINITGLLDTFCSNGAPLQFFGDAPGTALFSGPGIFGGNDTTATFRPSGLGAGTYTINYIHPNQGCVSSASQDVTVVTPVEPILLYADSTFCSNEADIALTASPAGGIFRIASPGCGTISGGNIFSPSLVPPMCLGQPINIQYEVIDINGCITNVRDTLKVYQAPTVTLSGLDTLYCIDAVPDTLIGTPVGGLFSGPGASAIGPTPVFTPPLAGAGLHELKFRYEDLQGCADSVLRTVRIDPPATIVFDPLDSAFCHNEGADTLSATPIGGSFFGLGIDSTTNVFDPASLIPGTSVNVRYRYINPVTGCVDIGRNTIKVDTVPVTTIDTVLDLLHCRERDPIVLSSTPISPPGVFSGNTIQPPNFFDPDGNVTNYTGLDTIVFRYTNGQGCVGVDTSIVNILPRDSVYIQDFPPENLLEFCYFAPIHRFVGEPAGGFFVTQLGDTLIDGELLPRSLPVDSVLRVYYVYDDGIGCLDSVFTQVRVREEINPEILNLDSIYCRNSTQIKLEGNLGAFNMPWYASDTNTVQNNFFYPDLVQPDSNSVTIYFPYMGIGGCIETASQKVFLRDTISSSIIQAGGGYCEGSDPVQLAGTPAGGWFLTEDGNYIDSTGVFDPRLANSGPNLVIYEVDDTSGCRTRTQAEIFIKPRPQLTILPQDNSQFTCANRFMGFTAEARDDFGNVLTDSVVFNWSYGNGENSQGITGSSFYGEAGNYDVDLEADFKGCTNDTTITVIVYANPRPMFTGDTLIFLGDTAYFKNLTTDADRFLWNFGDLNVANTYDAKHRYNYNDTTDTYVVTLKAVKEHPALANPVEGCFAFTRDTIRVIPRPRSDYELTVFPNPTSGILHVNLDLAGEEDVVLSLVDVSGRVVGRQVYPSRPEGFQTLTFEAGTIAEGIYILMIVAGDDLIELGGYKPGVVGPFGLRYNNRRKILIKR